MIHIKQPEIVEQHNLFRHGIDTMLSCTYFAHILTDGRVIMYNRNSMVRHIENNPELKEHASSTGLFKAVPIKEITFSHHFRLLKYSLPVPDSDDDLAAWSERVFLNMLYAADNPDIWMAGSYNSRDDQFKKGDVYWIDGENLRNAELKVDRPAAKTGNLCVPIYERHRADHIMDHVYCTA